MAASGHWCWWRLPRQLEPTLDKMEHLLQQLKWKFLILHRACLWNRRISGIASTVLEAFTAWIDTVNLGDKHRIKRGLFFYSLLEFAGSSIFHRPQVFAINFTINLNLKNWLNLKILLRASISHWHFHKSKQFRRSNDSSESTFCLTRSVQSLR